LQFSCLSLLAAKHETLHSHLMYNTAQPLLWCQRQWRDVTKIVNPNSYINFGLILQGQRLIRMANVRFEVIR
jgi:hypothetical protein